MKKSRWWDAYFGYPIRPISTKIAVSKQSYVAIERALEIKELDTVSNHALEPVIIPVPFFSQVDPQLDEHPLRSCGWPCTITYGYSSIRDCGCMLTSAAMAFKYYGADINPPALSDCLWSNACPFAYGLAQSKCGQGQVTGWQMYQPNDANFWNILSGALQQGRPVLIGMYLYQGNEITNQHWVLAIKGSGNSTSGYTIHDPGYRYGSNMNLSTYNSWYLKKLLVYTGTPGPQLTESNLPAVAYPSNTDATMLNSGCSTTSVGTLSTPISHHSNITTTNIITGDLYPYRQEGITLTIQFEAHSTQAKVTEMLIWTDSQSNTTWIPYTNMVAFSGSERIYVQYRDALGNLSIIYSTTSPGVAANLLDEKIYVYLPLIMR